MIRNRFLTAAIILTVSALSLPLQAAGPSAVTGEPSPVTEAADFPEETPAGTAESGETPAGTAESGETHTGTAESGETSEDSETFPPAVTDDAGRYQVWDMGESVSAWITVPSGMTVDPAWTNRYALTADSEDPDTLDAEAEYYVYNAAEGYQDFNMDDPLEIEAAYLASDEELSYNGPSAIETFQVEEKEYQGASLTVAYLPEDSAPLYTTEYLIWYRPDEQTIATVLVHIGSANPEPGMSMQEAARMFLYNVTSGR